MPCEWEGVIFLCALRRLLIDEYLQHVCFCGVECPLHAILFLIQNRKTLCSPHESFTVRHMHYFFCGYVFFRVDLFQGLHSSDVQTTGKHFPIASQ